MQIKKYKLYLKINYSKFRFEGKERIYVNNIAGLSILSLNIQDLDILRLKVNGIEEKIYINKKNSTLDVSIPKRSSIIDIEYSGIVNNFLVGMYKAKFDGGVMISTQFESVGARRVFPCIDNPLFKSIFQISIEVEKPYEVISNTKVLKILEKNKNRLFVFNDTPLMSTYLLYIGIGEFKKINDKYNNVSLSVISPTDIGNGKSVFNFLKRSLKFLEEYFDIPYPLSKLDLISVPEFGAGAMENWGSITFREVYLNLSKKTSTNVKRASAEVITHELVHQWFGNLVTMQWWNDLWLNESFATFMAFLTIIKLYPKWHFLDNFFEEKSVALSDDSLHSTHPIQTKVVSPDKIDELFDSISYNKGGSILYMIYNFIGDEPFRNALRSYLLKYQYSNAKGIDLWNELNKFSDINISLIMKKWIKYSGYPLIKVSCNKNKIKLEQQKFTLLQDDSRDEKIWPIPLVIRNGDNITKIVFDKKSLSITINPDYIVNINHMNGGFYRCFYDDKLLHKLIYSHDLSGIDIFTIISDRYALLLSGLISLEIFLSDIKNFYKIRTYIVVDYLISIFNSLLKVLYNNKLVKENALEFFYQQIEYFGIEVRGREDIDDNVLRGFIMSSLARIDDNFANRIHLKYPNLVNISPDLKRAIFISKVIIGQYDFHSLAYMYSKSKSDEEKMIIISAILASKKEKDIEDLYHFMLDGNIKIQDWPSVIIGSLTDQKFRDMKWDFIEKNIKEILPMFQGSYMPSRIMKGIIPFIGIDRKEELLKFLNDKVFNIAKNGISNGLEYLEIYENLYNRYNK